MCFSVNSKDVFDPEKNPGLKLSAESILNNKKIKKKYLKQKGGMNMNETPDILFVEQKDVDSFLKKNPEYAVAQAHSGTHPYILAKRELIEQVIHEEAKKNPVATNEKNKCVVIDITPMHAVERKFREYMIKKAKENNMIYVNENECRRYKI
jgi:hypothetical protein